MMPKPTRVPGCCQHYDKPGGRCYLSEQTQSEGHQNANCRSATNCKNCGNYESWIKGKNYWGK